MFRHAYRLPDHAEITPRRLETLVEKYRGSSFNCTVHDRVGKGLPQIAIDDVDVAQRSFQLELTVSRRNVLEVRTTRPSVPSDLLQALYDLEFTPL